MCCDIGRCEGFVALRSSMISSVSEIVRRPMKSGSDWMHRNLTQRQALCQPRPSPRVPFAGNGRSEQPEAPSRPCWRGLMKHQQWRCFGLRQSPGKFILYFVDCWACKGYNLKALPLVKRNVSCQQA
jgi:hypothetical protein